MQQPEDIAHLYKEFGGRPAGRQVRRFEGARVDRLTTDWFATNASINR